MTWLSEDPWFLACTLLAIAGALLIALKVTQQGKYLVAAGAVLGLAVLVVLVERLWVTEVERIEAVVLDLGRAVRASDADAALALMSPDVSLSQGSVTLGGPQLRALQRVVPGLDQEKVNPARALIRSRLEDTTFDILSITRVRAQAGRLTKMGTAEFRVYASGSHRLGDGTYNFATGASGSDWSVGLRQVDGQWKIERITAVRLPPGFRVPGMGGGNGF